MSAVARAENWQGTQAHHIGNSREIEKFITRQPPIGGKDDYDIETTFISERLPSSSRNSTVNIGHLNGKMQTNDFLQERAGAKNTRYRDDYTAVGKAFAPAIVSVAGQICPEFLHLLWVLADKTDVQLEEEIGSEAFTWSRARTFIFNKNSIGKAIAYATATRPHLSMHNTAPPARRQADQPISSAE